MNEPEYAKGITARHLRIFLEWWPHFSAEDDDLKKMVAEDKDLLFGKNAIRFSWCHLYDLPIKEQLAFSLAGFAQDEGILKIMKEMAESPNQLATLPATTKKLEEYFGSKNKLTKEEALDIYPYFAANLGASFSVYNSLRCVLYHGCYLNELIQRAQTDDKSLFDAVRIDPTVIGCKTVMARISRATLLQEVKFFAKLKAALNGKMEKREQSNYQMMRLVLEILHESGAERLDDEQLNQLFVEKLNLYTGNKIGGGSAKSLRKFADTYMKKNANI